MSKRFELSQVSNAPQGIIAAASITVGLILLMLLAQVGHAEGADTEVLLGSEQGLITRIALAQIPALKGKSGKGSRVMKLGPGDQVVTVTPVTEQLSAD